MKVLKTQRNSKHCLICGMENPLGLHAPFYELEDNSLASVFTFKPEHQSYPDRTHGGMVATLLDELMGRTLWIKEPEMFGVTTSMSIKYRKPTPYGVKLKARAYMTFNSARGFSAVGEVFDMDNNLLVQGEAKYFKIPFKMAFSEETSYHEEMCYQMPIDIENIDFPEIKK